MADFTGTPLTGPAPLSVTFSDASTGPVTSWTWDFGDGSTSTQRNPVHVFNTPGSYTVMLDVGAASGIDSRTRLDYVVVTQPPPIRTFTPVADARVSESSPTKNYGNETSLRIRAQSGGNYQSFLRFDLASLSGSVLSAKLRLFCTDASTSGGNIYVVSSSWTETGVNWNNRPLFPPSALRTLGSVAANTWVELDVTSAVTAPGLLSFGIGGVVSNQVQYSSRQGTNPAQLVIETGTATAPVAAFSGTPLVGGAPLLVAFTDQSAGATSFLWDFGDGGTSTERNPQHLYTAEGSYTVSLLATNPVGSDSEVRTGYVNVTAAPAVRVFLPVADARANEGSPSSVAGSDPSLRVRQAAGGSYHTYLRFDLSSLSGSPVSAKLRLYSTDGSDVAGRVFPTTSTWVEATLNWSNKPAPSGPLIVAVGAVATDAWAEFDLTSAVSGPGVLSFVVQSSSSNSCYYSSREGAHPPELVVTTASP